ncbi:MAG: ThiF family adenylyltransferase [Candidatus Omnitrophica bacterium]|nr:ThiF family adenylyltransferase [Candidatus Omnitrophota bacterium]
MEQNQQRFSRQILAFGKEGQARISNVKVGIVGLGGIGSFVVQMLAYLGVRDFLLIDNDIVEESNLNRLIGATLDDVKNKTPKVEVATKLIYSINPDSQVKKVFKNLRTEESIDSLAYIPQIIFGCVDNDSARLILTELSAAYNKTLIDSATEIILSKDYQEFGGRVIVAKPGEFCLLCAEEIDLEVARQELESQEESLYRKSLGYGLGETVPSPAVVSLNGTVASLAVTEFLMLVTGLREPHYRITYKGMRGVFRESLDKKRPHCIICNYLVGKKEQADIKRYLKQGLPKDLR